MDLAGWRGERTASVGYTKDGEGWVDFGASAMRNDGKQDGGDALELEARISDQGKSETMLQIARDLVREARAALASAAKAGQRPPAWIEKLLTPTGEKHYQELLRESGTILAHKPPAQANALHQAALPFALAPASETAPALATGG